MTTPPYSVPAHPHRVEETIKRSRFITTAAHASTDEAAHDFIEKIRGEFPDATHHCWAFVAGPPGTTAHIGMSDDGEPHGTAGRPMLNVLLHSEVGEIVCVCTRYYGGTKLGTGGLARAYSGGVTLVLESLPTRRKVERQAAVLTVSYPHADGVRRLLEAADVVVDDETFDAEVHWKLRVATAEVDDLNRRIGDATGGTGTFQVAREGTTGDPAALDDGENRESSRDG